MMSSIGPQLHDRDYLNGWVTADILVREEPDEDEDEEDEDEEEEDDNEEDDDDDEGEDDGYSE